jgi:hypothetical protein
MLKRNGRALTLQEWLLLILIAGGLVRLVHIVVVIVRFGTVRHHLPGW